MAAFHPAQVLEHFFAASVGHDAPGILVILLGQDLSPRARLKVEIKPSRPRRGRLRPSSLSEPSSTPGKRWPWNLRIAVFFSVTRKKLLLQRDVLDLAQPAKVGRLVSARTGQDLMDKLGAGAFISLGALSQPGPLVSR
jgi:hypothetical protein